MSTNTTADRLMRFWKDVNAMSKVCSPDNEQIRQIDRKTEKPKKSGNRKTRSIRSPEKSFDQVFMECNERYKDVMKNLANL